MQSALSFDQKMSSSSIFGTESGRIPPLEFFILQLFSLNENTQQGLEKLINVLIH